MRAFTVRLAHLYYIPEYIPGEIIARGDKVGRIGSSGQSTNPHLHIDVVEGRVNRVIRLKDIGYEDKHVYKPNIEQLNHFIDDELLGCKPIITSYYYDPRYKVKFGKDHPGYDLVSSDHNKQDIIWNRSKKGKVLDVGFDSAYGNYILIVFNV